MNLNYAQFELCSYCICSQSAVWDYASRLYFHRESHKAHFLAQLLFRARPHSGKKKKRSQKPALASGDFHNSVEMASALVIPHKWSKIEMQEVGVPHPFSTPFTSPFVFMCLLLGVLDLQRVSILLGNPWPLAVCPGLNNDPESLSREMKKMWRG